MTQSQGSIESTWYTVIRLLRWHKPAGRLILMIPALWAVFLAASGKPPLPLVGVIILGTLTTSGAGCVINDLWDRDIDPQVERTRDRPLASRTLSIKTGVIILIIGLICAAILAFYLNTLSFWLCVAAVPIILGYPLAKRFFPIPQLVLAIAWGFAVLISWTAVTAKVDTATWLLWGATVLWTLGFDTVYAMSDKEDDLKVGINSSAIFFGDRAPEAVGIFFVGTAALIATEAIVCQLASIFWVFWILVTIGWTWQYLRLRDKNLPRVVYGEIFAQNVWLGFILLLGMILGSIF
jgi:4-hydroxybenzoate polyprenyltransferase